MELVLVLPLLLVILSVIVETGRIFHEYDLLLAGVRSAARFLAENEKHTVNAKTGCLTMTINSADTATAKALINDALGALASPPSNPDITIPSSASDLLDENDNGTIVTIKDGSDCVQDHVQLAATYTHTVVFSWFLPACGQTCTIPMTASTIMRTQ